jgi:hypothetical protein
VVDFARALPPRRPMSAMYFDRSLAFILTSIAAKLMIVTKKERAVPTR